MQSQLSSVILPSWFEHCFKVEVGIYFDIEFLFCSFLLFRLWEWQIKGFQQAMPTRDIIVGCRTSPADNAPFVCGGQSRHCS